MDPLTRWKNTIFILDIFCQSGRMVLRPVYLKLKTHLPDRITRLTYSDRKPGSSSR